MKYLICAAALVTVFSGCKKDETVRAYGGGDATWKLVELNGTTFAADATIAFPEKGKITGTGPCNEFASTIEVPYPWFKAGQIQSSRKACPALAAETAYFRALTDATLVEVSDQVMILSNTDGLSLVFKALEQ